MASGPLVDASIPTVKSESSQHRRHTRIVRGKLCQASTAICWLNGAPFTTWLVETDVMAKLGQPVLSLVSRVFLNDHERIIGQLRNSGHVVLLAYALQLIHYFRTLGEDFAMQHTDTQYLGPLEEELLTAVLQAAPVEKTEGLSPEERVGDCHPRKCCGGIPRRNWPLV